MASSASCDGQMPSVKEECCDIRGPPLDVGFRCDLTVFKTADGGAVSASGSVAGSDGFDEAASDVSVMTKNVLLRFVSEEPF